MITLYDKEKLVESLKTLQDIAMEIKNGVLIRTGENGICRSYGICYNWSRLYDLGLLQYDIVEKLSLDWDKHSGRPCYPIEVRSGCINRWDGKELELRIELMEHIMNKLINVSVDELNEAVYSKQDI